MGILAFGEELKAGSRGERKVRTPKPRAKVSNIAEDHLLKLLVGSIVGKVCGGTKKIRHKVGEKVIENWSSGGGHFG